MENAQALEGKTREYDFTERDFEQVTKLIYAHAGISLSGNKRDMVYSRLSRRLREKGLSRFSEYLELVDGGDAAEWQAFTNALTTNLTSFYREAHHFPLLAQHLAQRGRATRDPLSIWCCAASTGEEPYSIALTVCEALGAASSVPVLCSDIDTKVLAKAQAGIYPADVRGLSTELLKRYFFRGTGRNEGFIRVRPELQRLLDFRPFNLIDGQWSLGEPFDIVFCRNVMIYFDGPTQRGVLERMRRVMKPQGLLFAGHSENFGDSRDLFRLRGQTVYESV